MKNKSLTPKQALFVQEYIIDLNATQAAVRAGYSPKTATEAGSRLLTNVKVRQAIQKLQDKRAKKLELTADKVLKRIEDIGDKADKADRYNEALKAQELLGKHLKLFTDKVETTTDKPPDLTINFIKVEEKE